VFDGWVACGIWRLQIYDMWYWDTGILESAELIISISEMVKIIPAPPSLTLLSLGAGLTLFFRRRRA
jgi:hypothetical protein